MHSSTRETRTAVSSEDRPSHQNIKMDQNLDCLNKPKKDPAIFTITSIPEKCDVTIHEGSIKELSQSEIFEIFEKHEREAENYNHLPSEAEVNKNDYMTVYLPK